MYDVDGSPGSTVDSGVLTVTSVEPNTPLLLMSGNVRMSIAPPTSSFATGAIVTENLLMMGLGWAATVPTRTQIAWPGMSTTVSPGTEVKSEKLVPVNASSATPYAMLFLSLSTEFSLAS